MFYVFALPYLTTGRATSTRVNHNMSTSVYRNMSVSVYSKCVHCITAHVRCKYVRIYFKLLTDMRSGTWSMFLFLVMCQEFKSSFLDLPGEVGLQSSNCSSELSAQSFSPSQSHTMLIHLPFLQRNSLGSQTPFFGAKHDTKSKWGWIWEMNIDDKWEWIWAVTSSELKQRILSNLSTEFQQIWALNFWDLSSEFWQIWAVNYSKFEQWIQANLSSEIQKIRAMNSRGVEQWILVNLNTCSTEFKQWILVNSSSNFSEVGH